MHAIRRIRKLVQKAHGAHVPRALWIAAAVIALPLQASGAPSDEPPPLPRPRPAEVPPRTAPHEAAPAEHAQPEPAIDQACLDRLGAAGIEFESITLPPASKSGCAIDTPVRLKAVKLAPRWRISIWLPDLVAPLIAGELAVELKSVRTGPGYECRNRNRAEAGKISAHASGLAADVASFELANGRTLTVKPDGDEHMQ